MHRLGPIDGETGIVPAHPPFRLRGIMRGNRVAYRAVVGEGKIAMGKAARNIDLSGRILGQGEPFPTQEGGRARPQVDDDIVDRAADAANDLYLGMRRAWKCIPRRVPRR